MLQQTQVSRVKTKLPEFLEKFPSFADLARAPKPEVVRAWKGMGYNNRAIRLHATARAVCERYGGYLPADASSLEELPGIGRYTSHALLCFAYRRHVPVVDVNIRRVLSRIFWRMTSLGQTKPAEDIWSFAQTILPRDTSGWNQALMDLGATICTARRPKCAKCPAARWCSSQHSLRNASPALPARKTEPTYESIPHRLWRGRIVEHLRLADGPLSLGEIGRAIKPDFTGTELPWLRRLINALAHDGIVATIGKGAALKVSLAS
jgi:A/G-specific adenine glycosylase